MNWKRKMIGLSVLLMVGLVLLSGLSGTVQAKRISGHYGTPPANYRKILSQYGFLYNATLKSNVHFTNIFNSNCSGYDITTPEYTVYFGIEKETYSNFTDLIFERSGEIIADYEITLGEYNYSPTIILNNGVLEISNKLDAMSTFSISVLLTEIPKVNIRVSFTLTNEASELDVYTEYGKIYKTLNNAPHYEYIIGKDENISAGTEYKMLINSFSSSIPDISQVGNYSDISYNIPNDKTTIIELHSVLAFNSIISTILSNQNFITHYKGDYSIYLNKTWAYYVGDGNDSEMSIVSYHSGYLKLEVTSNMSIGGYIIFKINKDTWDNEFGNNTIIKIDNMKIYKVPFNSFIENTPTDFSYTTISYSNKVLIVIYFKHFSNHYVTFENSNSTGAGGGTGGNSNTNNTSNSNNTNNSIISKINNKLNGFGVPIIAVLLIVIVAVSVWLIKRHSSNKGKEYYKELDLDEVNGK